MLPSAVPKYDKTSARCCCGCCSLTAATSLAVFLCKVQCIIGLFLNVLLFLQYNGSSSALEDYFNFKDMEDMDVIHGLTIASICILSVWLFLAGLAFRGNSTLNRSLLTPWFLYTYVVTHFDVGTTVYFSVKFQASYINSEILWMDGKPTTTCTYLCLLVLFSRGAVVWFLNIYLAHVVNRRGVQIEYNNSMLALYILSHLSPNRNSSSSNSNSNSNSSEEPRPNVVTPPKNDCHPPSYLPSTLLDCNRGHLESSWSLNTDTLQGVSGYANPLYQEYRRNYVYGNVPTYQQAIRYDGQTGILPY